MMKPQFVNTMPDNTEIELSDGKIIYRETGSYTILPSQTIKRAKRVLRKIGVDRVEQIAPKFTDGIPIFRLNETPIKAKCHRQLCWWSLPPTPLNNPRREGFGKGMTVQQSKASAVMEAVERYCAQSFPHHKTIKASYENIADSAIHPAEFNFPTLPLKCGNCVERDRGCFQELQNVCQEWSWGYSLINKTPLLVPSALVYYPYISESNLSFMFNDTGGLAAGNTLGEAVLQGIAEVIERDALYYAFNLGNLESIPLVNFTNTKNRYIKEFITEALPAGSIFAFHIQNKNLGLNIPSFAAFVCYKIGNERRYFGGSGTSLDPEVGLLRALTELEQQKVRQKALIELDASNLVTHNSLKQKDTITFEGIPNQSTGNIKSDVELYLDRLSSNDTDVIVINLTHPEIGIPVVRVLIPKLISYSGSPIRESLFLNTMRTFGGRC